MLVDEFLQFVLDPQAKRQEVKYARVCLGEWSGQ
jgi:hypothetical protein